MGMIYGFGDWWIPLTAFNFKTKNAGWVTSLSIMYPLLRNPVRPLSSRILKGLGEAERASERVAGGGELEEIIAVGDKSLKVRSGVDNLSIDFGSQTESVTIDFLMASTVTGAAGARACQVIIRQDSTLGGHVVWGQLEPGVANYYDGAQWNFIGDTQQGWSGRCGRIKNHSHSSV